VGKRKNLTSGSTFEEEFAYSRAVSDGRWVFVSGTTGYDYSKMTISSDPAEQAAQCFENIKAALADAEATLEDIVRVNYLVPNRSDANGDRVAQRGHENRD
jgi:enamine deaminase RidA (YjgF/YER057c/UK114 family)